MSAVRLSSQSCGEGGRRAEARGQGDDVIAQGRQRGRGRPQVGEPHLTGFISRRDASVTGKNQAGKSVEKEALTVGRGVALVAAWEAAAIARHELGLADRRRAPGDGRRHGRAAVAPLVALQTGSCSVLAPREHFCSCRWNQNPTPQKRRILTPRSFLTSQNLFLAV